MGASLKKTVDRTAGLISAISFIRKNYVLVGIPEKKTDRQKDDNITNAELLFIHTNGSPINNIPARPVVEPAIAANKDKISDHLKLAFQAVLNKRKEDAYRQIQLAGMRAQNAARVWFLDAKNGWAPNAPSVRARKIRKGSTDPKPLIDTGELRKSITYVVVKEGERQNGTD